MNVDEYKDLLDKIKKDAEEFQKLSKPIIGEISSKTKELVKLSEKYGIPFDLGENTYVPKSMRDYKLDEEEMRDIMENYATWFSMDFYDSGWMNSSSGC